MAMHLGEQDSNCESLVVSQNFVLCQDGLTPCHLMLSLSGLTGISRPSGSAHIWGVLNACFTSASGWPGIALSSGSAHRIKIVGLCADAICQILTIDSFTVKKVV
nr:uncharacterized protein LOC129384834 [Dermacentor andersoni]